MASKEAVVKVNAEKILDGFRDMIDGHAAAYANSQVEGVEAAWSDCPRRKADQVALACQFQLAAFREGYRAAFAQGYNVGRRLGREEVSKSRQAEVESKGSRKRTPARSSKRPPRNGKCPCGSGQKYKHCCDSGRHQPKRGEEER